MTPLPVNRRAAAVTSIEWALMALGFAALIWGCSPGLWGDGGVRADMVRSALLRGVVPNTNYSFIGPAFSLPLLALDQKLGTADWWFGRYNVWLSLAGAGALWWVARGALSRRMGLAVLAMTPVPFSLLTFYGEPFTAWGYALGLLAAATGRWAWALGLLALAGANTPVTIPAMGLAVAVVAWHGRTLRLGLAPVLAAGLVVLEAWLRRGSPFDFGYRNDSVGPPGMLPFTGKPGFSYPLILGVLSMLFSFGRGLIFFYPALWLAPLRTGPWPEPWPRVVKAWLVLVAGLILSYAKWWAWHGANYWGPRFLLVAAFPAAFYVAWLFEEAVPTVRHWVGGLAVLLVGGWVGLGTVTLNSAYELDHHPTCRVEGICIYVPEFTSLLRPLVTPLQPLSTQAKAYGLFVGLAGLWLLGLWVARFPREPAREAWRRAREGLTALRW